MGQGIKAPFEIGDKISDETLSKHFATISACQQLIYTSQGYSQIQLLRPTQSKTQSIPDASGLPCQGGKLQPGVDVLVPR